MSVDYARLERPRFNLKRTALVSLRMIHWQKLATFPAHARTNGLTRGSRIVGRFGLAALAVLFGCDRLQNAVANGETRTLSMHHMHTDESITITYKRNGRYDEEALKKIDWFLRDWRRQESTRIDPHTLDILWEVATELKAQKPIEIVCGYRAPATNEMLRRRSSGVAKGSLHTHGQAIDFYIPDVSLVELRYAGLRLQRGGVGFYPSSGSPFVHMDTGRIRHWPGISRQELARVFPNGRTVHVPTDGEPLAGYALALKDVEKRGAEPSQNSLDAARSAGIAAAAKVRSQRGAKDDDDDDAGAAVGPTHGTAADKAKLATRRTGEVEASARQQPIAVPLPLARPAQFAQNKSSDSNGATVTSRGEWERSGGLLQVDAALTGSRVAPADAGNSPSRIASLGYAQASDVSMPTQTAVVPVSESIIQKTPAPAPKRAQRTSEPSPVAAVVTSAKARNADDIWTRAMWMAPDLQNFMSTTLLGAPDFKQLRNLMEKPNLTLAMSFSDDPDLGAGADRFSGETAVVFLATVPVTTQSAMLQQ